MTFLLTFCWPFLVTFCWSHAVQAFTMTWGLITWERLVILPEIDSFSQDLGINKKYALSMEPFYKEPTCRLPKYLKTFSVWKIFVTANNHELESRFPSFTAKTHVDTLIYLLSYLICAFGLESWPQSKLKFRMLMLPCICTILYGSIHEVKIKELLRNF